MFNEIIDLIMRHTAGMDYSLITTQRIIDNINDSNIRGTEDETDNRERLINQLAEIQGRAEGLINSLADNELTEENVNIVKAWLSDLSFWVELVQDIDRMIINALLEQKDEVSKEIATLFKSKMAHNGYSPNNIIK